MMQVLRVIKLLNDFGSCYFVVEAVQQHQHEPPKNETNYKTVWAMHNVEEHTIKVKL